MKITHCILATALATTPASAQWNGKIESNKDDLTGELEFYSTDGSITNSSKPTGLLGGHTKAFIYALCSPGQHPYIGIRFTRQPNLLNDDTQDGYSVSHNRVLLDDVVYRHRFTQTWGSNFMFSRDRELFVRMMNSDSMALALVEYGDGEIVYRWSLAGSKNALTQLRETCMPHQEAYEFWLGVRRPTAMSRMTRRPSGASADIS